MQCACTDGQVSFVTFAISLQYTADLWGNQEQVFGLVRGFGGLFGVFLVSELIDDLKELSHY